MPLSNDNEATRPDKALLKRLSAKRRKAPLPPLARSPRGSLAPPPLAGAPGSQMNLRQPTKSACHQFKTQARTLPGMGGQLLPKLRDGGRVNPWHDHKASPPLPYFAAAALRDRLRTTEAVRIARAEHFSADELRFFSAGDELATIVPLEEEEEEEALRWWQRLARRSH